MPPPKHQTATGNLFAFVLAIVALLLFMSWSDSRPIYKPKPKGAHHAQTTHR